MACASSMGMWCMCCQVWTSACSNIQWLEGFEEGCKRSNFSSHITQLQCGCRSINQPHGLWTTDHHKTSPVHACEQCKLARKVGRAEEGARERQWNKVQGKRRLQAHAPCKCSSLADLEPRAEPPVAVVPLVYRSGRTSLLGPR